jgi:hypothetical protein
MATKTEEVLHALVARPKNITGYLESQHQKRSRFGPPTHRAGHAALSNGNGTDTAVPSECLSINH